MQRSESIAKIAPALVAAQKQVGAASKGASNPFFKTKYADLGSVMEACKAALNENGITVLQPVGHNEQGQYVETILLHESGEFVADKMLIVPVKPDPQAQGSAITYARRYALQSMVFIPAEDDDGESAMSRKGGVKTTSTQRRLRTSTCPVHNTTTTLYSRDGKTGWAHTDGKGNWCRINPELTNNANDMLSGK